MAFIAIQHIATKTNIYLPLAIQSLAMIVIHMMTAPDTVLRATSTLRIFEVPATQYTTTVTGCRVPVPVTH